MVSAQKTDAASFCADAENKNAPYTVSSVGDMKVSFFSGTNLCDFLCDCTDVTLFRDCYEFLCVQSGSLTLECADGTSVLLTASSAAVVPPDCSYKISSVGENTLYTLFFFNFERVKPAVHGQFSEFEYYSALFALLGHICVMEGRTLLSLIESMGAFLRSWDAGIDHVVQTYMAVVFVEICGAIAATGVRPAVAASVRDDRFLNKTHRRWVIENYISNCYMHDNPTEELMLQLFLSKRQTDRVVCQIMGESLANLITKQRIRVTEQLLHNTQLTLQEISERVGYHSYSGFYNAVRKYRSVTPEILLQKCREGGKRKTAGSLLPPDGVPKGNRTSN